MDKSELAVFAVLGASVTIGLMQMGSDALQFYRRGRANNNEEGDEGGNRNSACPTAWGKTDSDTR